MWNAPTTQHSQRKQLVLSRDVGDNIWQALLDELGQADEIDWSRTAQYLGRTSIGHCFWSRITV